MSLLNKTTATAAPAPRAKAAVKASPVVITGVGLACHAGDEPYALISSVLGQMSGVQISDEHKFKQNNGVNILPRMAPMQELFDNTDRDRMYALTTTALEKVAVKLSANVNVKNVLIAINTNSALLTRYQKIDTQHLQNYLIENIPLLSSAQFRILPNEKNSSTSSVRTAIAELNEGKWEAIVFGGADSLISIFTCMDLHEENRLNFAGNTEGVVPGEAAAFVVLQTKDRADKDNTPILAYLRGIGVATEQHARDADIEATEGLSNAIGQALAQSGLVAEVIQGVVHNLGAETVQSLEWHQTSQAIWPRRVSEQQRIAVQNGEIEQAEIPDDPIPQSLLPYMTMGEVGAAALPIQLATALAWMEYDTWQSRMGFPVRENILICDTPDAPERGALIMSTKLAAAA